MHPEIKGLRIRVSGIVQGVGFRPFVFNLAEKHQLKGFVKNTSHGVDIEIAGPAEALGSFLSNLQANPPPLARIDQLSTEDCDPGNFQTFEIQTSQALPGDFLPVSPDMSICPDCQAELLDPTDRRFRYPFINCTNCGPRFTIIQDIPYDRPNTTMSGFEMCPACLSEYHNPRDRRFHAQPIACPTCGPQLSFVVNGNSTAHGNDALEEARTWIRQGKIIAVKGLGGYHLACDAANPQAVAELRRRKKRSDKPFALMAFDIQAVDQCCILQPAERELLISREKPVVLLEQRPDAPLAGQEIAPGLDLAWHHAGIHAAAPAAAGAARRLSGCAGDDQRQPQRGTHRLPG